MDEQRLRSLLTDLWSLFERVHDLEGLLRGLVNLLGERIGADLVAAYLFHERGSELTLHAAGGPEGDASVRKALAPATGPVGQAFSSHPTVSDA